MIAALNVFYNPILSLLGKWIHFLILELFSFIDKYLFVCVYFKASEIDQFETLLSFVIGVKTVFI